MQVANLIRQWHIKLSHQRTFSFVSDYNPKVDRTAPSLKTDDSFLVTPIVWEVADSAKQLTATSHSGLDPNVVSTNMASVFKQAIKTRKRKLSLTATANDSVQTTYEVKAFPRFYNVSNVPDDVRRCILGLATPLVTVVDYAEVVESKKKTKNTTEDNNDDGDDSKDFTDGATDNAAATVKAVTRTATTATDGAGNDNPSDLVAPAATKVTNVTRHDQLVVFLLAMVQAYDCRNVHVQQFLKPDNLSHLSNPKHCRVHMLAAIGDSACAVTLGVAAILGCDALLCCSPALKPTLMAQHSTALKHIFKDAFAGTNNDKDTMSIGSDSDASDQMLDNQTDTMETDLGLSSGDDAFQTEPTVAPAPDLAAGRGKGRGRGRGRGNSTGGRA